MSKQNPTPEFTLMLSADEVLVNAHRLREYCKRLIDRPINVYEAHIISIKGEVDFQTHRLSRVDTKWRYVGRVHEVLVPPDYPKSPWRDIVIPDLYIAFRPTDVKRRKETQLRILKILEEDKQSNPDDHRTSFYLARTYADVGQSENAISEFKHRISLGGWFEEIYMSHMGIAREMRKMSYPWKEIQRVYLSAFSSNPDRAEPLFEISSFLNKQKEFSLACNFAKKAFSMKYPRKSSLFVDYQVYQWKAAFEYARCSWELGNFFEGSRAVVKAYQTPKPMQNKELKILYESFKAKMKELGKEFPPSEDINFHWISWVILLCIALLLLVSARFIIINERPSKSKKE